MPQPVVAVTQVYPGVLDVPGARVVVGPERGFQSAAEIRAFVAQARPDVLVSMYFNRVDRELLDAAGPQVRGVVNFAVGFDNIDLGLCAERGIAVCNTPDAVTEGTADIAFLLMLAAARRLSRADRYARSPEYPARGFLGMSEMLGVHLSGQTLLIVGAGRIGYATALRGLGWGMKTLYVARSRHLDFEFAPLNAERVELDEGLRRADFVSIHCPLTPETRHLINRERLALMKKSAVLVNTARGPVVEESALVEALKAQRIFGAGLDVYEFEPRPGADLIALDNVVLTPHIGSGTFHHRALMTSIVASNVRAILAGERPPNTVPTRPGR
ncbi:MAG: D-glycerate dehydrogenase [Phycisphaerales bacterium]|nr:D-glycerate dehydrogenase [Phycisphaerales bacterium]